MNLLQRELKRLFACFLGALPGCYFWCWEINELSKDSEPINGVISNAILIAIPVVTACMLILHGFALFCKFRGAPYISKNLSATFILGMSFIVGLFGIPLAAVLWMLILYQIH